MAEKVDRLTGAAMSTLIATATVVKAPFWAIYQGIPLGVASLFSKAARRGLRDSFDDHFVRPVLHDIPAGLSGEVLNTWEDWKGWARLRDHIWPPNDPERPQDPAASTASDGPSDPPPWRGVPDLYATLEIRPNATPDEIQSAYRRLVKTCHPDVNPSSEAHTRFVLIDRAYKVLRDAELRRRYDRLTGAHSP
jgi:hypothetical protein